MSRVTAEARSTSRLPELFKLSLSRPLVTVPLAAVDLVLARLGGRTAA